MIVPLRSRGRTHGVITLATSASDRRYDESDLAFAVELARRAATAVDTARLYQDRDQVARTLQRTLLPPTLPDIPYAEIAAVYHPAGEGSEIGGDFYDAFETGDGAWTIAIGDVCGKGAAAAAITGLARHTLRAAAFRERSPRAVLERLNRALLREVREESFCTVAAGRLSPARAAARSSRPAPAATPRRSSCETTGRVDDATAPGTLLGIYSEIDVSDRETVLAPGESVVFYTDGVTEERREGEQFGEDRLPRAPRRVRRAFGDGHRRAHRARGARVPAGRAGRRPGRGRPADHRAGVMILRRTRARVSSEMETVSERVEIEIAAAASGRSARPPCAPRAPCGPRRVRRRDRRHRARGHGGVHERRGPRLPQRRRHDQRHRKPSSTATWTSRFGTTAEGWRRAWTRPGSGSGFP